MIAKNQYDFNPKGWLRIIFITAALAWFLLLILSSCTTERKAVKYMDNHGFQAAKYCAKAFPVRDSIIYQKGEAIIKSDTTYLEGDSIPCPVLTNYDKTKKGKPVYVHCPPSKIIHDSVFVHDTVTVIRENTAKVKAQQGRITLLIHEVEKYKPWKGRALWTWGILSVLIGGGIVLKVKSII